MKRPGFPSLLAAATFILAVRTVPAEGPPARGDPQAHYAAPKQLAILENRSITESSGLAVSRRRQELFWTHNDSGDYPRIFAFDRQGQHWGEFRVTGAHAIDWEDMASFVDGDSRLLLLADVGDNLKRRSRCSLYVVEEPSASAAVAPTLVTLNFQYEDGPQNCEAVAVDATSRTVLLVAKSAGVTCSVYRLSLPRQARTTTSTAKRIAQLSLPLVTAMDISPGGRRAIVLTYGHAYEYSRGSQEDWDRALSRSPRTIEMPARRQGESICYGNDGKTLYLTSERTPTPLWEVPLRGE